MSLTMMTEHAPVFQLKQVYARPLVRAHSMHAHHGMDCVVQQRE
jgi:hypothetical protein